MEYLHAVVWVDKSIFWARRRYNVLGAAVVVKAASPTPDSVERIVSLGTERGGDPWHRLRIVAAVLLPVDLSLDFVELVSRRISF